MVLERIANPSLGESRVLSSSLSRTAKHYHAQVAERSNARDCKSWKPGVQIPPCAPYVKYSMENEKPYYVWRGQPLTKLEFIMLKSEIIADVLIEQGLALSPWLESQQAIDKIKNKPAPG